MQLFTLRRLLVDELEEAYRAEQFAQEALPRMEKGAANAELKRVFKEEAARNAEQLKRLEAVFSLLKESPRGGHAKSVKILLSEFEDRMGDGGDPPVVDAALIAAGRRIQHWGIATYGANHAVAQRLQIDKVAALLEQTLAEKRTTDDRLAQLAMEIPLKGHDEGGVPAS